MRQLKRLPNKIPRVTVGQPARTVDDATADALVEYYRAVAGREHPDWDEYRQAMVDEGRLLVHLAPGSVVVTVLCDAGWKYLSGPPWS